MGRNWTAPRWASRERHRSSSRPSNNPREIQSTNGHEDYLPSTGVAVSAAGHGTSRHSQHHISHHGSPLIRKYTVEALRSIIRSGKGPFFEYYQRLAEVHGHSRAAVATARKLVVAAYTLMRERRPATEVGQRKYQPSFVGYSARPSRTRWLRSGRNSNQPLNRLGKGLPALKDQSDASWEGLKVSEQCRSHR